MNFHCVTKLISPVVKPVLDWTSWQGHKLKHPISLHEHYEPTLPAHAGSDKLTKQSLEKSLRDLTEIVINSGEPRFVINNNKQTSKEREGGNFNFETN